MEQSSSPLKRLKLLEGYVYNLRAARELNMLPKDAYAAIVTLRNDTTAARTHVGDYFASDDTKEKILLLENGIESLTAVRDDLLLASQHDLLSPADVAHLSAMAEEIMESLR